MKVLFEDRYGRYREIADVKTKKEVNKAIFNFLKDCNFKSYYTRTWVRNAENCFYVMYDVGSHSEFFCVPFDTHDKAVAFLQEGV
jgi:hypothetical protein